MPNINECFPSSYLKASDLRGQQIPVVIDEVRMEVIDGTEKPIVFFVGKQLGLVLNKTNAGTLSDVLGAETDAWNGRSMVLFPAQVMFQGRMVDCIRVLANGPAAPAPTVAPVLENLSDDIPF